jgi:hypothetical protein
MAAAAPPAESPAKQRLEDAKQLAARIRARLDQDRLQTIEGKATEIED